VTECRNNAANDDGYGVARPEPNIRRVGFDCILDWRIGGEWRLASVITRTHRGYSSLVGLLNQKQEEIKSDVVVFGKTSDSS
jgi:hypothetical protein